MILAGERLSGSKLGSGELNMGAAAQLGRRALGMIHFQCPLCGASFEVAPTLAGRKGRCKRCGGRVTIPTAAPAPASAFAPAAGSAARGPAMGAFRLSPVEQQSRPAAPSITVGRPTSWLDAVNSQVALAPITAEGLRAVRSRPSPLDEPSIPGPYKLATAPSLPALAASRGKSAGAVTRGYRGVMGKIQKLFRWINESAYLVSVPFLMCLLLGLAINNHSLMVLGATVVILLNVGRIVAGLMNLVVIPFRESPIQGILFLIPPITFFYLAQNWHRVHRPVKRIIGPICTILLVAAAFVVEPWIRGKAEAKGTLTDRVQSGVGNLGQGMKDQMGGLPNLDVDQIQRKANAALKTLKAEDTLRAVEERLQGAGKAIQDQVPAAPPR